MPKRESQVPSTWPRNAPPEESPASLPWSHQDRFDLNARMSVKLRHIRYELFKRMRPLLRLERLTEPQWRLLSAVEAFPSIGHAALVRVTGITECSVTRIIRALVDRGLVLRDWPISKRTKFPTVRHYQVVLTRRAEKLFRRSRAEAQTRYLDVEATFGEVDLAELYRLMDRFIVALRGAEFEPTEVAHRSHPLRDDFNGRWISNAEGARRKELSRIYREGL